MIKKSILVLSITTFCTDLIYAFPRIVVDSVHQFLTALKKVFN